jgi:hypothetical protein
MRDIWHESQEETCSTICHSTHVSMNLSSPWTKEPQAQLTKRDKHPVTDLTKPMRSRSPSFSIFSCTFGCIFVSLWSCCVFLISIFARMCSSCKCVCLVKACFYAINSNELAGIPLLISIYISNWQRECTTITTVFDFQRKLYHWNKSKIVSSVSAIYRAGGSVPRRNDTQMSG